MSGAASESCFPFTLQPDFSERFVNGKQPRASRSAHCLGMLMANNRCRSLRGRRKKGRGRGREKSTKEGKGKGAPAIRAGVFVIRPPFSQLIR